MSFQIKKASRKNASLKIGLAGPSGAGKTYSSLLLASGLVEWGEIVMIDTEKGSGHLYSGLGSYNVLELEKPYHPNRYIEAINTCIEHGFKAIIIDSLSHEWDGEGGCLEMIDAHAGKNKFAGWAPVTKLHNRLIEKIVSAPVHIIGCMRSKTMYELDDKNKPIKLGLGPVQRDGFDYEFSVFFDINIKHYATVSKDRTGLFIDQPPFLLTPEIGEKLHEWSNSGVGVIQEPQKAKEQKTESPSEPPSPLRAQYMHIVELCKEKNRDIDEFSDIIQLASSKKESNPVEAEALLNEIFEELTKGEAQ